MTESTLVLDETPEGLARRVADEFLSHLRAVQKSGREPQIALTGGTIAELIHEEIGRQAPDSGVDWTRVVFWWGDERFVAPDSPDRNAAQAKAAFLDAVGATQVHEMPSTDDATDPDAGAAAYSADLRANGGGSFDIVMLGIGPDGHIASLFPGFPQLDVDDQIAVGVTGSPKPPPERISLTFAALNHAKEIWFVVAGAEKADAVRRARAEIGDVHETPARGVRGSNQTVWYVDRAAAGGAA